jgi:hypothetical protein
MVIQSIRIGELACPIAMVEATKDEGVCVPSQMLRCEQFAAIHSRPIFSRIPLGRQVGSAALLEWVACSDKLEVKSWLDWQDTPSDHASLLLEFEMQCPRRAKRPCTTWSPADPEKWARHIAAFPVKAVLPEDVASQIASIMMQHRDQRTCKVRRSQREPF